MTTSAWALIRWGTSSGAIQPVKRTASERPSAAASRSRPDALRPVAGDRHLRRWEPCRAPPPAPGWPRRTPSASRAARGRAGAERQTRERRRRNGGGRQAVVDDRRPPGDAWAEPQRVAQTPLGDGHDPIGRGERPLAEPQVDSVAIRQPVHGEHTGRAGRATGEQMEHQAGARGIEVDDVGSDRPLELGEPTAQGDHLLVSRARAEPLRTAAGSTGITPQRSSSQRGQTVRAR